jgi:head-tail adaptor
MARRNLHFGGAVPMDPGQRDRPVTIQQLTESVSASGFPSETWTTLASVVWMSKNDVAGDEKFAADRLSAVGRTRWEMGYRADMDPDVLDVPKLRRLLYQGRYYDIVSASQIGRKEGLELLSLLNPARTTA